MDEINFLIVFRLAIALALGLIIGMERGWERRTEAEGTTVAGIRTFGFLGLLGGLAALLTDRFGSIALAIAFLSVAVMAAISYVVTSRPTQDFGITTELAMLITFVLGALAGGGLPAEALAAAVVTAVVLGFKQELHQSLAQLDRRELIATLQLLLLAAVALPLLPDRHLGPWQALNPRSIGWLVLLIAGISYTGYFAMRLLGSRVGLLATAVLGGLVSSTAVTLSFGQMARRGEGALPILGAGISLAAGIMAVRILLQVSVVNPALLPLLIVPISLLAIVPLIAAVLIATRIPTPKTAHEMALRNPIELGSALALGAVFAVLFILIRAFEAWFGDAGIYLLAAISGITDVDAVSLSLAQSTRSGAIPMQVGATGILIAAMVNTVVKATLATTIGGWKLARWCATILLTALGLSAIALLLIR